MDFPSPPPPNPNKRLGSPNDYLLELTPIQKKAKTRRTPVRERSKTGRRGDGVRRRLFGAAPERKALDLSNVPQKDQALEKARADLAYAKALKQAKEFDLAFNVFKELIKVPYPEIAQEALLNVAIYQATFESEHTAVKSYVRLLGYRNPMFCATGGIRKQAITHLINLLESIVSTEDFTEKIRLNLSIRLLEEPLLEMAEKESLLALIEGILWDDEVLRKPLTDKEKLPYIASFNKALTKLSLEIDPKRQSFIYFAMRQAYKKAIAEERPFVEVQKWVHALYEAASATHPRVNITKDIINDLVLNAKVVTLHTFLLLIDLIESQRGHPRAQDFIIHGLYKLWGMFSSAQKKSVPMEKALRLFNLLEESMSTDTVHSINNLTIHLVDCNRHLANDETYTRLVEKFFDIGYGLWEFVSEESPGSLYLIEEVIYSLVTEYCSTPIPAFRNNFRAGEILYDWNGLNSLLSLKSLNHLTLHGYQVLVDALLKYVSEIEKGTPEYPKLNHARYLSVMTTLYKSLAKFRSRSLPLSIKASLTSEGCAEMVMREAFVLDRFIAYLKRQNSPANKLLIARLEKEQIPSKNYLAALALKDRKVIEERHDYRGLL
mgnify:CR=1 FL=1|tara:strand:- start:12001 stop:13815 length:1815 start_codon:yes stop_codon:yes gene_type:complete